MSSKSHLKEKEKPICFVIMPISDVPGYDLGHFGRVYEQLLKPAIIDAGYVPVRADDTNKTDYIVVGVVQKVVESPIVLCDYSSRNPNVLYELGIRHTFNRPVVLVKDTRTEKVFDIQGLRYTEYDPSLPIDTIQKDISSISSAIKETASNDKDTYNSVVHLAGLAAEALSGGRSQVGSETLRKEASAYGIKIKSPREGTQVSEYVDVSGTYQIKPPDGSLRIFLVSNVNERSTWPHAIVTKFDPEKKRWFCSIRIGGGRYTSYIVAAIVEGAGQVLWDYYFQVASITHRDAIQSPLSYYAIECDRVKVERVE